MGQDRSFGEKGLEPEHLRLPHGRWDNPGPVHNDIVWNKYGYGKYTCFNE